MGSQKTVVVLGGYGLIGSACIEELLSVGFSVVGVGRSLSLGAARNPKVRWLAQDLTAPFSEELKEVLASADVIVNASGALQTGLRDDLDGVHVRCIASLIEAASESDAKIVHISAAGVSETATTEFLASKFRGDMLLAKSDLDWVILRPTLVIGAQAYGGSALLRSAASLPLVGIHILPEARVQTVYLRDVAKAVLFAGREPTFSRAIYDLTEREERSLLQTITLIRQWLGFEPWIVSITLPTNIACWLAKGADLIGWLGWRSPFRTTTLETLKDGVLADPNPWEWAGGFQCRSLEDSLKELPSSAQERLFARLYLIFPIIIGVLSVFWIVSGIIGLISFDEAVHVLVSRGVDDGFARLAVTSGSFVDLALGLSVLVRAWVRPACLAMIVVSIAYLVGATCWTPDLWLDPLGVLVKVLPAMALPLVAVCIIENR